MTTSEDSNPDFAAMRLITDQLDELAQQKNAEDALIAPKFYRNPLPQAQDRVLWQGFPQARAAR